MEELEYWRLCSELTVIQAALLISGINPSSEVGSRCEDWKPEERPDGYEAAKSALAQAILSGGLNARIRRRAWQQGWIEAPAEDDGALATVTVVADQIPLPEEGRQVAQEGVRYRAEPDWELTTVRVEELQEWLKKRGVLPAFFFPQPPWRSRLSSSNSPALRSEAGCRRQGMAGGR